MIIAIVHCIEYHEWPHNINPYWSEAVCDLFLYVSHCVGEILKIVTML